jgi:hypothetical protein
LAAYSHDYVIWRDIHMTMLFGGLSVFNTHMTMLFGGLSVLAGYSHDYVIRWVVRFGGICPGSLDISVIQTSPELSAPSLCSGYVW